jgi:hypothetical protein
MWLECDGLVSAVNNTAKISRLNVVQRVNRGIESVNQVSGEYRYLSNAARTCGALSPRQKFSRANADPIMRGHAQSRTYSPVINRGRRRRLDGREEKEEGLYLPVWPFLTGTVGRCRKHYI